MNNHVETVQFLATESGRFLAYEYSPAAQKHGPTVVFLCGFKSDLAGTKAQYFREVCVQNNLSYLRFDYSGHGRSSGEFEEGCISEWSNDAVEIISSLIEGSIFLVGSSMGGWIMLHAALAIGTEHRDKHPHGRHIAGMVGIASAPDFTKDKHRFLSAQQQDTLRREGKVDLPSDYFR